MLQTGISEHRNHIRRNSSTTSVITNHRVHHNHEFDWNKVEILDVERFYYKRIIAEVIHIKRQIGGINLQTDTEGLDRRYITIFNYL